MLDQLQIAMERKGWIHSGLVHRRQEDAESQRVDEGLELDHQLIVAHEPRPAPVVDRR